MKGVYIWRGRQSAHLPKEEGTLSQGSCGLPPQKRSWVGPWLAELVAPIRAKLAKGDCHQAPSSGSQMGHHI